MLIPHECHKPDFQVGGPVVKSSWLPISMVAAPRQSFGTKHHEEKAHKRKRRFRYLCDDESNLSEEAQSSDSRSPEFATLLNALAESYG